MSYYAKRSMIETFITEYERKEVSKRMRSMKDVMISLRDC